LLGCLSYQLISSPQQVKVVACHFSLCLVDNPRPKTKERTTKHLNIPLVPSTSKFRT